MDVDKNSTSYRAQERESVGLEGEERRPRRREGLAGGGKPPERGEWGGGEGVRVGRRDVRREGVSLGPVPTWSSWFLSISSCGRFSSVMFTDCAMLGRRTRTEKLRAASRATL